MRVSSCLAFNSSFAMELRWTASRLLAGGVLVLFIGTLPDREARRLTISLSSFFSSSSSGVRASFSTWLSSSQVKLEDKLVKARGRRPETGKGELGEDRRGNSHLEDEERLKKDGVKLRSSSLCVRRG